LDLYESRTREAKDVAVQLNTEPTLIQRIENLLEDEIPIARRYLSEIERETPPERRVSPNLHRYYADRLSQLESGHADIMTLLLQPFLRIVSDASRKEVAGNPLQLVGKQARFFKVPDKAYLASVKILDNCLYALYGDVNHITQHLEPMVVHWVHYYYKFMRPSTICMPWIDMTKLCHWPHLAHESFHSKIYNILDNIQGKRKDAAEASDLGRVNEYEKMLSHLLTGDWSVVIEKWNSLEERFIETLRNGLGDMYKEAYLDFMKDNYLVADRFLQNQFQEFVCDLGSNRIAGPSGAIHYATMCADNLRSPVLDLVRHLTDILHPPDIVRTRCQMLDLSKQYPNDEKVKEICSLIDDLMMIDVSHGLKNTHERISAGFLDRYFSLLTSNTNGERSLLDGICELANSMLNQGYCYNNERWQNLVSSHDKHFCSDDQAYQRLYPYDFVNTVWLRLIEIARSVHSYKEYVDEYTRAESDLGIVWKKLISCTFSRSRKQDLI
jgi:hypothetical protein